MYRVPFSPFFWQRASMRRAWKSPQLEIELISRKVFCDGSQTLRS